MATKQSPVEFNEDEWESVSEGARTMVQFNVIGDRFRGFYEGHESIEDPNENDEGGHDTWEMYNFIGILPQELAGERVGINASKELRETLNRTEPGVYNLDITLVKTVPIKSQPTPMKSYRVLRQAAVK